jgi:2-keto-4-pentenoate hydratase/2-oxohepta-3-ene-1,7-dioic acid hydratase in catechol pathway
MRYQHRHADARPIDLPPGKVVCVGRNYADHARELNNEVPPEPVLFIKPATSLLPLEEPFDIPAGRGRVHFETELALLIGTPLTRADEAQARRAIAGIGVGLDLTLRDLQDQLKRKGLPWEKAKGFDGACPVSGFIPPARVADLSAITIRLSVNGAVRQEGRSGQMITPVLTLLSYISHWFTLQPGDLVLTGTPAGVGPVQPGDRLRVELVDLLRVDTRVNPH